MVLPARRRRAAARRPLGFIADATFDVGNDGGGGDLLVFEVNGWHNLVHILSGLVLLGAAASAAAKTVALASASSTAS